MTTYFQHDRLGSGKLQIDGNGNVLSTDVTKPFGPRICAEAVKDEFTTLDAVDTATSKIDFDASSGAIRAPKGANGYQTGELYTTELKSGVDARVVKLDWTGSGVTFYVSTDGSSWSTLQKDQSLILGTPARSLYLKAVLAADASSVLDRYLLQINPNGFNLFTGKMLTEETGLVYFGARWYDPELGRFITVDPAEDGENWYQYCRSNPLRYYDPDGRAIPVIIYMYLTSLAASPDLQLDTQQLAFDISKGDYLTAAADLVGIAVPGLPASATGGTTRFVSQWLSKHSKGFLKVISDPKILNTVLKVVKKPLQIHHWINQATLLGKKPVELIKIAKKWV